MTKYQAETNRAKARQEISIEKSRDPIAMRFSLPAGDTRLKNAIGVLAARNAEKNLTLANSQAAIAPSEFTIGADDVTPVISKRQLPTLSQAEQQALTEAADASMKNAHLRGDLPREMMKKAVGDREQGMTL